MNFRKVLVAATLCSGAALASLQAQQPAAPQSQGYRGEVAVKGIPGVIVEGAKWKQVWQMGGNNADGIVSTADDGLLLAQEDANSVTKLDKNDYATIFLSNTHGVGSLSIDSKGRVLGVERMVPRAVAYLTPEHKILADTFDGKPASDLGRLNDLVADKKGGAYFSVGGAYYASASGKITRIDNNLRTNGIVLSRDQKTLYVTNGPELVAFDVQPDGSVKNQRHFANLEAGGNGDGSTIDSAGRVYVSSAPGVQVFSSTGMYLGVIPTPWPIISVAFSGPGKKMLYIVANGARDGNGNEIHEGPQKIGRTIYKISMLSHGIPGQPK